MVDRSKRRAASLRCRPAGDRGDDRREFDAIAMALRRHFRIDIDAPTVAVKAHLAIDEGENGVIATETDALARVPLGPALTDDDIAGDDGLTAEFLHAAALAIRVASVFDTALSFFMGHGFLLVVC